MPKSMNTQPNGLGQVECKPDACLLKTAVAIVTAGDKQTRANILFDNGAQRSFVSQKLADLLNLNPQTRENITISTFGANTPLQQSLSVVSISVKSLVGEKISVTALVVPNIATPLQNTFNTCIKNMLHLQGLTLAHPITDKENFEISLLIGSDHYWNFVGDHIVRGNGPIAMQSKLGYLLSEPLTQSQTQFSSGTILHVAAAYQEDNQDFWNMEPTDTTGC